MHRVVFLLLLYFALFIISVGCSPFEGHDDLALGNERRDWLSNNYVDRVAREQLEKENNDPQIYFTRMGGLHDLQNRAEILIKIQDTKAIRVLAVRTPNVLPLGTLAVSDFQKYLSSTPRNGPLIDLAVIIVPSEFFPEVGWFDELSLVRSIDEALRNAGVKRRVFQIYNDRYCVALDSADTR